MDDLPGQKIKQKGKTICSAFLLCKVVRLEALLNSAERDALLNLIFYIQCLPLNGGLLVLQAPVMILQILEK
jgi:hypothetical protein